MWLVRCFSRLPLAAKFAVCAVVLGLVLFGGGYAYLAYTTHSAPAKAHLPGPGRLVQRAPSAIDGVWRVVADGQGFAGYRVREQFVGLPAPDDAVGRTPGVRGTIEIRDGEMRRASFVADMQQLTSDQPPRDGQLRTTGPQTNLYPTSTFRLARPITLPRPAVGRVLRFRARGALTVRGITRTVEISLEARWTGALLQVAGSVNLSLAAFRMTIGSQMGMNVSNHGTLEFQLNLAKPGSRRGKRTAATGGPTLKGNPRLEPAAANVGEVVFSVAKNDHVTLLYRAATDGTQLLRLTAKPKTFGVLDKQPTVSPDGRTIVFVRSIFTRDGEPAPDRLYALSSNGRNMKALTSGESADNYPSYSPDASQIAFVRGEGSATRLMVMNADGTQVQQIHTPGLSASSPAWSPNGQTLVFAGYNGSQHLYVVPAKGGELKQLTSGDEYDYSPVYSRNGRSILYGRDGHLYRSALDGSRTVQLTKGPFRDATPTFLSDGRWVIFGRGNDRDQTFAGRGRIVLMRSGGGVVRRVPLHQLDASWPSTAD